MIDINFTSPVLIERRQLTLKYHAECCDKYKLLLGDIKKYNLHSMLDWGDTYITGINKYGFRINHTDDEKNIMLFHIRIYNISKEDKLNEIFKENIIEDENDNRIIIDDLTANELKDILFKIHGF